MSDQKPRITLKLPSLKKTQEAQDQGAAVAPQSATAATPKLTLKFSSTSAATPSTPKASTAAAAAGPKPSKSGRKPKPTAKKRTLDNAQAAGDNDDDESDSEPLAKTKASTSQPPIKKLKITTGGVAAKKKKPAATTATAGNAPGPSYINLKNKHARKIPERPLGVGYDSEASDREDDPTIDEALVLRMPPGEDCDYVRASIAANTLGANKDVHLRFVTSDGRRACLTVRGRRYAAVLVDLPCVVEAMKSWNKKEWYKSADVCQMLLVLGRVGTDEDAISYDTRKAMGTSGGGGVLGRGELDEKTWAYAHGLTPPMRWVRKRRFRKRISTKLVEEDEMEVERLLKDDADAKGGFTYRQLDMDALEREQAEAEAGEYDDYEDADGEAEEAYDTGGNGLGRAAANGVLGDMQVEDDDDLEAHLEAEMLKQAHEGDAAAAAAAATTTTTTTTTLLAGSSTIIDSPTAASPPLTASAAGTPSFEIAGGGASAAASDAAATSASASDDASSPSSSSSASDDRDGEAPDDAAAADADDDAFLEQQQDRQRKREEIADLEAAIAREEQRLQMTPNQILKQKIAKTIQGLKADLELKMMGGAGDDEDEEEEDDGDHGGGAGGGGGGGGGLKGAA